MTIHATGTYEGKTWDEMPYAEGDGGLKLARASVTNAFQGDVDGVGTLEYLMVYRDTDGVPFIGYERVVGRIGGRAGTFVLQHTGTYADGKATATWSVVPGSGTGELTGLRGEGGFVGEQGQPAAAFTLDYELK